MRSAHQRRWQAPLYLALAALLPHLSTLSHAADLPSVLLVTCEDSPAVWSTSLLAKHEALGDSSLYNLQSVWFNLTSKGIMDLAAQARTSLAVIYACPDQLYSLRVLCELQDVPVIAFQPWSFGVLENANLPLIANYPSADQVAAAVGSFIHSVGWQRVAILTFHHDDFSILFGELVRESLQAWPSSSPLAFRIRRTSPTLNATFVIGEQLESIRQARINVIVLVCSNSNRTLQVLMQAANSGMMRNHMWLLPVFLVGDTTSTINSLNSETLAAIVRSSLVFVPDELADTTTNSTFSTLAFDTFAILRASVSAAPPGAGLDVLRNQIYSTVDQGLDAFSGPVIFKKQLATRFYERANLNMSVVALDFSTRIATIPQTGASTILFDLLVGGASIDPDANDTILDFFHPPVDVTPVFHVAVLLCEDDFEVNSLIIRKSFDLMRAKRGENFFLFDVQCTFSRIANGFPFREAIEAARRQNPDVDAIIGPGRSTFAFELSPTFPTVPIVDYASLATELSNMTVYGNYFRSVASSSQLSKAVALFIKSQAFDRVQLIGTSDAFSVEFVELTSAQLASSPIVTHKCSLTASLSVDSYAEAIRTSCQDMAINVLCVNTENAVDLLQAFHLEKRSGPDYTWIIVDGVPNPGDIKVHFKGAVGIRSETATDEDPMWVELKDFALRDEGITLPGSATFSATMIDAVNLLAKSFNLTTSTLRTSMNTSLMRSTVMAKLHAMVSPDTGVPASAGGYIFFDRNQDGRASYEIANLVSVEASLNWRRVGLIQEEQLQADSINITAPIVWSSGTTATPSDTLPSKPKDVHLSAILYSVGTIALVALAVVVFFVVKRGHRVTETLQMKERLLDEYKDENIQLKSVWEIAASDIKLEWQLDKGGYGVVWRGTWDGMPVAVKILHKHMTELDEGVKEEFQKEVDFLQRTRHPNIVRFFGAGEWHTGVPFLVVELVERGSLRDFLRPRNTEERPHIEWSLKMTLVADVARGVSFIHGLKQIHRDLKPANVLITKDMRGKIADFGTIRRLIGAASVRKATLASQKSESEDSGYEMTSNVGTLLYMAPEMLRGAEYDQSVDVWSFGVLFWEVLTQQAPDLLKQEKKDKGPSSGSMVQLLESGQRLAMPASQFPEWTQKVIEQCWNADPDLRPSLQRILRYVEERK